MRRRRKRKVRVPARRRAEKLAIWGSYRNPVGFKFYGKAKIEGQWKHFEVSVIVPRGMSKRLMYFWTRETWNKMQKRKLLPYRHYYHTYRGFWNLHKSPWIKVEDVEVDIKHTAT